MSRRARRHVFKVKQLLFARVFNHLFHYSLEEGKEPEDTVWKFNPVIKIHNANPPVAQLHLFYHQKIWVVTCNFIRETAGRGSSVRAQESQRSHPLRLCAALQTSKPWRRHRNLPKGQKSGGIKLRDYRNLKIHLCSILKLRNRDSDNQKRFNKEDRRFDGADVQEGRTANPVFWHWWKIIFACQTCTKVTFYHPNRTWNNRVFWFLAVGY